VGYVTGCSDGLYGYDCSCSSNTEKNVEAVCKNATWTLTGDLQIKNQVWLVNTDFVHVLGNFNSEENSVLVWTIDLYTNRHGYLKVEMKCHLKGKAIFKIRSPVGEYNISVAEFSPLVNYSSQLQFDVNGVDNSGCNLPMNASLEIKNNIMLLKIKVFNSDCHPSGNILDLKYIILIIVGSILLLLLIILGIYLWIKRQKHWKSNQSLREYIDEGYDDVYRQEEMQAFLSHTQN